MPASLGSDVFRDSRVGFNKPVFQRDDFGVADPVGASVCAFADLILWPPLAEGMMVRGKYG
jgi:hypothetical protein